MPKTRKLALMAMFTAASLIVFVIEAQIPAPIPVPGVKLGLANIVTLIAMVMLSRREAGLILLVRIAMGSMFTGGVSAFIFSIAGGALAYAVMCLTLKPFSGKLLWVVSVLGAIAHNLGQLIAAIIITKTSSLMLYAPVLLASAVVTGAFTGLAAMYLTQRLDKRVG